MKRAVRLLVLILSLTVLWGCELALIGVGAGIGAGTYKFIEGKLVRQYPVEYAKAWDAANTALANLQISISGSLNEGTKGEIEAVRKDGSRIFLSLKDMGQKVTSIGVRVGTFGDRSESEKILDEIARTAGI
jgi:hypothetical protein